ncbi:hypothetical protein [Bradyrhizobium sp. LMTR 3]|uniref:hypothetical protein n=1 Tax=Bradyrhizobium sp. LMTR 3 TaxID=189873 RepID=UPI000810F13E|nr:hypothetical protein [Bradyrhizobium sp. LMTR 3]OCK53912.1 hypothetical protein LMTR3_22200 [Bradyrhizobium sp. LMTR 3]
MSIRYAISINLEVKTATERDMPCLTANPAQTGTMIALHRAMPLLGRPNRQGRPRLPGNVEVARTITDLAQVHIIGGEAGAK